MNNKEEYDLIISLGGNCSVASQCIYRNLRRFSLPLDYCFMANEKPIIYLKEGLKNRFKNLCLKENLAEMKGKERGDEREIWQYKDTYSEYRFIHLFGDNINNEGVYEKGIAILRKRIDRLYEKISQSKRILVILSTDFVFDEKYMYDIRDTFKELYPDKEFVFYTLMFRAKEYKKITDGNMNFIYSMREVNMYDFERTNYEWNFLDNVIINFIQEKQEKHKFKKEDIFCIKRLKKGFGIYFFKFLNTLARLRLYVLGLRFDCCIGKDRE